MTAISAPSQTKNTTTVTTTKPQKNYGKIILTLYNCLLPENVFKETPSQTDGLDIETETDLRILGCELIQTAGILLKLPQVAMATGQIYLQRFYYSKSFVRYPMETMAMGSIYLASKVEEKPCRIRDVINVFHHIKQVTEEDIREVCHRILQLYKRQKVNPEELETRVDMLKKIYQANKHMQAQKDRENAKAEEKKLESPTASTSKDVRRDSKKEKSPKTPPLSSKYHSSHKSKKERRSRSPYDRKREYSSKRHKSRSRDRDIDRSRERRLDDKRSRVSSRKYDDYERSKSSRDSRDDKRKH